MLECGFGWLPFWVRRMDEQVSYVGRTATLKHLPSEHFAAGRVFCNIEAHEREPMFNMVTEALGDGVLMFGSDYPHYESWFPHSIDKILEWRAYTKLRSTYVEALPALLLASGVAFVVARRVHPAGIEG